MAKIASEAQWADLISKIKAKQNQLTAGTNIDITNDVVSVTGMPTNVSDLTNDSDFQTSTQVTTSITNAIAGVTQFDYEVVSALPATGEKGTIYLVANSGTAPDTYDEYVYVNNSWEKLGSNFTLPMASASVLGGVKVGSGLNIDANGVLTATGTSMVLYNTTGQNTDGAMTQKAVTDNLPVEFTSAEWTALWA